MTEEKIKFTRRLLVLGNLGLLVWVFTAFFAVFLFNQIVGWLYLLFLVFMAYAILRRLGCSSCYKCKTCNSGFGRLAGAFFGSGAVHKESVGNRQGLVGFMYILLLVLPTVLLSVLILNTFSYVDVIVLVGIWALAAVSLGILFKR